MDLLFTLLLCSPYPAIGFHTARSVVRDAGSQSTGERSCRRPRVRTWLYAAAMVPLWPSVDLVPPLVRWARSRRTRLRRRFERAERSS